MTLKERMERMRERRIQESRDRPTVEHVNALEPDVARLVYEANQQLAQRIERLEEWVRLLNQPQATLALEVLELRDKLERYRKSKNNPIARARRAEEKRLAKQREAQAQAEAKLASGPDRAR